MSNRELGSLWEGRTIENAGGVFSTIIRRSTRTRSSTINYGSSYKATNTDSSSESAGSDYTRKSKRLKLSSPGNSRALQSSSSNDLSLAKLEKHVFRDILITSESSNTNSVESAHQHQMGKDFDYYQPTGSILETDASLWEISDNLHGLDSADSKPQPSSQPLVWAESRQALCEALPYYRSYQTGGYCTGGLARAFMFDSHSHPRDYMDSTVIISRAGGGMTRTNTGGMTMTRNQEENAQVESLRNNIIQYNPVVIIVGQNCPKAQCSLPHMYNVFDWFKPTHVWHEKSGNHTIIRYRFEKLKPETASWWKPQSVEEPIRLGDLSAPVVASCKICHSESLQVYLNCWMCLDPGCSAFWLDWTGSAPVEKHLQYDPRFLKKYTTWPHSSEPSPVRPQVIKLNANPLLGENISYEAWRGIVCPNCGRCNVREEWLTWRCPTRGCGWQKSLPSIAIPPSALRDPFYPLGDTPAFSRDICSSLVRLNIQFDQGYRVNMFSIPGIDGFVAHLIANRLANEEIGGPNDMFTELQQVDIGLRRRTLVASMGRGGMVCKHFTVNFGMPYKFIASAESKSFDESCEAVKSARSRLNYYSSRLLGREHTEFNEVLALGYYEGNSISWHDDGEFGLGPTIGTVSLGFPAVMKLRMKNKHYLGVSKTGVYTDAVPIPGCLKYCSRLTAHSELESLRGNRSALKAKAAEVVKDLELKNKGNSKEVISMHLNHGDIVIMHGSGIQQYYEHCVEPSGKLRFALTCRYIDPESLEANEHPAYQVVPDPGTYRPNWI